MAEHDSGRQRAPFDEQWFQDGQWVASGGDHVVRLWNAGTQQLAASLKGHSGLGRGVAVSSDGQLVASVGVDGTVRVWEHRPPQAGLCEATNGQLLATLDARSGLVMDVALTRDGELVSRVPA